MPPVELLEGRVQCRTVPDGGSVPEEGKTMTTRTFRRCPAAFASLDELLDWSERQGATPPTVHTGHDGSVRGSVEVENDNNQQEESK